jgi:quinol monooxygenase YgiN
MGTRVSWLLEGAIKPGRLDDFRALVDEMVDATRAEPGALDYEWFVGESGNLAAIYERYADSAAGLAHVASWGPRFSARFLAAVEPTRLTVLGNASDELKAALSGFGPIHFVPLGGFVR